MKRARARWLPALAFVLSLLFGRAPDAGAVTTSFREGASGYASTEDTELQSQNDNDSFGPDPTLSVDSGQSPTGTQQVMIRFENMFGNGAGRIPLGATIDSAMLTVEVSDAQPPPSANITLHRMLVTWSEAATWNSMVNGIQFDDAEAASAIDATIADPASTGTHSWSGAGVAATVQAWSDGATNHGWAIQSDVLDNWTFASSENGSAATRPLLTVTYSFHIAGSVFEDLNYGGGAGRGLVASSGVVRSAARVELFDSGGAFVTSTTTGGGGAYQFSGLDPASYTVRVVNGTVTSSRTGYVAGLLPIQTYRTDASGGSASAVTDHVGGEVPSLIDAGNGSTTLAALTTATTTAQSIAPVTVSTASVTGADFGYCFDVIVNAANSGQGSLGQWLTNANALSNTGLAQSGLTAGIENAIWMLADGTARPGMDTGYATQFSGGIATIAPTSALPAITDAVVIDATTQPGWSSTPIVELNGAGAGAGVDGLAITAAGSTIRGLAINRFPGSGVSLSGVSATGNWIAGNRIGTDPGGTVDRGNGLDGVRVSASAAGNTIGGSVATHANLIAYNDGNGVTVSGGGSGNGLALNSVHSNTSLGIDLAGSGVTANDGVKTGGQPNLLMDHPVFTSAVLAGGSLTVSGYVGSAAGQAAFASSRVEIFESDADASGFGEGQTYLGFLTSSGSNGNFSGSLTVTGIAAGDRITATATDGGGNTSEFGAQQTVDVVALTKRAYLADGTPITNLSTVPKGTLVKFLLYLNNQGPLVSDVSVQDVLDPGFQYVTGSMRFGNTLAACASPTCTLGEEAAIFAAANAGTTGSDAADGDVTSRSGATLNVGNQSAANAQLDIAAARVWAVVFSVRTQ